MIFKDIDMKELFRLMKEHEVSEVSLHDGKVSVDVKRSNETVVVEQGTLYGQSSESVPMAVGSRQVESIGPVGSPASEPAESAPAAVADNYYKIEAPLVGTFYRASSPDSDPFVEVGDRIKSGDVLCIVEAMKSMNEIQSDVKGIIKEICIENSNLVEFEQVMFKVDTAG